MAEIGHAVPVAALVLVGLGFGEDDAVDGGFEEAVCPVGEEVAYVEEDGEGEAVGLLGGLLDS